MVNRLCDAGAVMAALLLCGCGYVGNPMPPLANVPARVTELAAVQRDARIIVHFKLPPLTTEGMPVKAPLRTEIRIGKSDGPFIARDWVPKAQAAPSVDVANDIATCEIPTAPWVGQEVIIAARVVGANGKDSDWVTTEGMPVVPPPQKPADVKIGDSAQGLRLTWSGPPGDFRIFRRAAEEKSFSPVDEVQQLNWTDPNSEVGKSYTYIVQRIVKLGVRREAESDPSDEVSQALKDSFPPAAPAGLRASPAAASIELSWERNAEADLAGYRVYRSKDNGPFEKIADLSQVPSYSDRAVRSGERYRYAITAFDKSGNEGERSQPVDAAIQ